MAKILLVEDDKSLREIYGVRLQAEGYEIVSAGDGEEALAMAIKEKPDLIVSDVMMPKISGFDMLDILRSTTETKNVRVIMMTALSSDDQRARGEALGADRYLVKSQVGIEDVVRTVHDVLSDGVAAPTPAPSFPTTAPVMPQTAPAPMPVPVAVAPVVNMPAPVAPVAPTAQPAPVQAPAPVVAPAVAPQALTPAPVVEIPAAPQSVYTEIPAPVAPAPVFEPAAAPVVAPAPAAPAPIADAYAAPAPQLAAPVAPAFATPAVDPAFATPIPPAPAPVIEPASTPVTPQAQPAPAPVAPAPSPYAAPAPLPESQLPQPTAPFSTAAPASLGERIIQPLVKPDETDPSLNIALQMEQALGTTPAPQDPSAPSVPPSL